MSDAERSLFGLRSGAKDALVDRMRSRRTSPGTAPAAEPPPGETRASRFADFEGYQALQLQVAVAEKLGIDNPFFREHDGVGGATIRVDGRVVDNFASYNYLDLNGHPEVVAAAKAAIDEWGTSASASRPVSGERPVQRALEQALADVYGVEDCVVFVSGHATNVATIGHLFGPEDLIAHDALIHNSVLVGAALSGAQRIAFPHNDHESLRRLLQKHRSRYRRLLIVLEGVYSMDGDIPDLPEFVAVKEDFDAFLMVDEAHAIGVLGERGHGIAEHFGLPGDAVDIWMGTLSKTLASCGGYIAGDQALVDLLKCSAPGFFYSVGIAPPLAAASLKALEVMRREPTRVARLHARSLELKQRAEAAGLDVGRSAGYSVNPIMVGSSANTARLANLLYEQGIATQPIIYPGVEEAAARLRLFMSCAHTSEQIERVVEAIRHTLGTL